MKIIRLYIIRLFAFLLLLMVGGLTNEALGKITYHILSLPINTKQHPGTNNIEGDGALVDFQTNVRVEVLRVVSSDLHVNLPFEYRSPLATNYRYYAESHIAKTGPNLFYGYNNTKYYFYNIKDNTNTNTTNNVDYGDSGDKVGGDDVNKDDNVPLTEAVSDGVRLTPGAVCDDNIHIYVTYDVKASPDIDLSTTLNTTTGLLSAGKTYNIHLKDRMVVLNQNRQNRPGAVLDGYYTPEQLSSDDFSWIVKEGLNSTAGYRYFSFKFGGNDPYNVTIYTAYNKNTTFRATGKDDFFTTDVKEKDKYSKKDVFKEYRGASFFRLMGGAELNDKNMWLSSDADIQWQEGGSRDAAVRKVVPGYYKGPEDKWPNGKLCEMSPIFNSFAILNHKSGEGYAFAGSKMNTGTNNYQPKESNGQIQYMDYRDNGNNITIVYKAEASACKVDVYEVKEYVFRVKTPFGSNVDAIVQWTNYDKTKTITTDMVPDELKRKYVEFKSTFKADTNGDGTPDAAVTTFENAQANCSTDASGRPIIYVEYDVVGAPFTAITAANKTTGYASATWYEMTDKDSSGKKIKWDATNSVYKNNGGASEYNKESEFAFIGDPYELRIINRALTATNSRNFYVGSSSQTTDTDLTNFDSNSGSETAGFKWEIPYDETLGSFTLREFGSTDAYWQWNTSEGNNIKYSTSASTRIKVMEIGKVNYTFKVVDLAGNIAIQATESLTPFTTLTGYANIPADIRSPYIADETVTFYGSYTDRNGDGVTDRRDWHYDYSAGNYTLSEQPTITELPATASDIYVSYTTTQLANKNIKLIYTQEFNVKLNEEYIYWDNSTNKILSKKNPSNGELESNAYLWHLRGRDPYAMRIDSKGNSINTYGETLPTISAKFYNTSGDGSFFLETVNQGGFVCVADGVWDNNKALNFVARDDASRFIAMMSNNVGVYEVLAATGTSDYYHIGRESTSGAETRIYSNATYPHGADELRFELAGTNVTYYHLIDLSGNELFTNEISSKNPRMTIPSEYVSPLVEEYYYYPTSTKAATNLPEDRISEIAEDTHEDGVNAADGHIYVRYKTGDFGFNNSPYVLKFLNPYAAGYLLEDGADKLISSKIQAVYPYCNGDGNLNIYGQPMNEEQMNGGSSTRPRWIWYFENANRDPYHVKIHSKSTISFNGTHTTYFQTQAVHFKQDENDNLQHIVTGANFPGISQVAATEYMVLGTTGRYKLVTTNKIAADLNGDGDTTDEGENERRTVNSFEQYWKTYNMIKQHVLGIDCKNDETYKDVFSTVRSTFVIPDELRSTLATKLNELGIGSSNWHSYNAIANGLRWNGFNNEGKANTKTVEELEHWFQTFDMGDGTFDIETADIPAVLVLLDRHGWEIMRLPLPTGSNDPQKEEKLAALRAFDSPMVKEYKFYNNATKASNCHKYILRMQNGAERDPITQNGVQYISTSLADLPPLTAKGVVSSGAINDQFVTYTVKEEYEKSYQYSLDYTEIKSGDKITGYTINSETGTPSAFIVLQNDKYAQANGSTIDGKNVQSGGLSDMIINPDSNADSDEDHNIDNVNLWYVQPNLDIDNEMGIPWSSTIGNSNEPYMANETKVKYKDKTGFDPYNIQLKNVSTGTFFTSHMTDSKLSGGAYSGIYSGVGGSEDVTLANKSDGFVANSESYDHSHLKITNQTFMAVQDENGNMQLMPRFDHTKRINVFSMLADPLTEAEGDHSGAQTTQLVRPLVFDYRIIDNDGNTALRYKAGGEFYPEMPGHFKSPLAKDFKYYYGTEKGTPTASTVEEWENAEIIKQKTATDETEMNSQIEVLTVPGDYYFKIGSSELTYKKVNVGTEITGSFAAAGVQESSNILVRYSYDKDYDTDHDNILQGRWMTVKLGGKDVQATGTVVASNDAATSGTGVSLYGTTKPADAATLLANKQWHWKFLPSPSVSSSNYYVAPDPYAVKIFNRNANYDATPTANPNKMGTPIKISGKDRFVILAHPDGDYALAAAGDGLTYSFLNGSSMTEPSTTAASVLMDVDFTTSSSYDIADGERLQFVNDVTITYTYKVITNDGLLAASQTQDESSAISHDFTPFLPEDIRTPLLNDDDYLYYGTASKSGDVYTIISDSKLNTIYGLYDDVVYVHYNTYDELKSPYKVPNQMKNSGGTVARGDNSNDTSLGLLGNLLYNIVWYDADMMKNNGTTIDKTACGSLDPAWQPTANTAYEWQLVGNDPYAIQIKSIGASGESDYFIHKATATTTELNTTPTTFMILNRDGYNNGVLVMTGTPVVGGSASMLSGYGDKLTTDAPNHFIIFALSTFKVIYHLMIKNTGDPVIIPYKGPLNENVYDPEYKIMDGSTQRDLTTGSPAGATFQLGKNIYSIIPEPGEDSRIIGDSLYCVDAGHISLGDKLKVPDELYRPNVVYKYFIEGVYNAAGTSVVTDMNNLYQGTERTTMGDNAGLLGTTVLINIIYTFDGDLETNAGEGFVTDVADNQWYTFETNGATPYLAHYTNAWGLQSMAGRATRFTNDYLWTPLGDPYGFKMYNRYMCVNSAKPNYVMTTPDLTSGRRLMMGEPGVTDRPAEAGEGKIPQGNEIYELLASETDGYFNIHPLYDTSNTLFVKRGTDDFAELSTTPTPWTFGLDETLFEPYYERAGYLGGLTTTPETGGKAKYEEAAEETNPAKRLMKLQKVVYDVANIIPYAPGYYRLHSQPGVSGISPVRYASGYLHKSEMTAGAGSTPIPMHFYSRKGVSTTFEGDGGLGTGFTETPATRGPIPVPATEYDPSTIFYFPGTETYDGNPRSTLSTQGLYVKGVQTDEDHGDAVMTTDAGEATTFSIMDIGAGIFLIHDGSIPALRKYLHFSQSYTVSGDNKIYDLKYFHNSPTDDAKWCIEPANIQGLMVTTNSGGDGYYYSTFCAPYDVQLPADDVPNKLYYNAYICTAWDAQILHPTKVPASGIYDEGKFVPAGTPFITRTNDISGKIKLTLPNASPTTPEPALGCVFTGKFLEQMLATEITTEDMVFTFGLPITGYGIITDSGTTNGDITSVINKDQADTGVGFYVNANPNKELSKETGQWTPNNRYVLHNKIYYRAEPSPAPSMSGDIQFIPVIFDNDSEEEIEDNEQGQQRVGDGCIYDLMGRRVATQQQVQDGSWRSRLAPGIYILNGRKFKK